MTEVEEPRGVIFLKEALAERLGRPAATRVAKSNPSEWYIFDPCFSVIQRGVGSAIKGYRSGIQINNEDISFYNVHSRTPAQLLRTNLKQRPEAIIKCRRRVPPLKTLSLSSLLFPQGKPSVWGKEMGRHYKNCRIVNLERF